MKLITAAAIALALSACTTQYDLVDSAPQGQQVTSSLALGGIKVTSSRLPVTSGNYRAIPTGNAGDGGQ